MNMVLKRSALGLHRCRKWLKNAPENCIQKQQMISPRINDDVISGWQKFSHVNETFKRIIGILVNWHISNGVFMRTARAILVKMPVEMCQFTRIPMTRLKVSFILENFSQVYRDTFDIHICICYIYDIYIVIYLPVPNLDGLRGSNENSQTTEPSRRNAQGDYTWVYVGVFFCSNETYAEKNATNFEQKNILWREFFSSENFCKMKILLN